ncbi:MAG TPA: hypothetical protein VJS68_02570 [Thermoplasmata archaeon]|nr:hypothetical protein [Thermoplasmata archaeon]
MGLLEVFLATVVAGISLVNAIVPLAAFRRTRDPRFWLVVASHLGLAALGGIWVWGTLPVGPPPWTAVTTGTLLLATLVVLLFLGASLVPRRTT